MVLGLTLGKSKRKHSVNEEPEPVHLRASPSLPELNPTAVSWPSNLVTDTNFNLDDATSKQNGNVRASLSRQSSGRTISFSKPFKRFSVSTTIGDAREKKDSMGSSYPPSAFERAAGIIGSPLRSKRRPQNIVPNFNIMIVGTVGSGKTSLMRLLLGTSNISKGATPEQRAKVEQILQNPSLSHDSAVNSASVEIEEGAERLILTLLDTPGFHHNELDLERAITTLVRMVGARYDETLNEESKVVRQSGKGDHHIHLCLYLISPTSLREYGDSHLKLDKADITAVQRLSERVNVLPILTKADTMTDERMALVKAAVNRDLRAAGLPITLLGSTDVEPSDAMEIDLQEDAEYQDENEPVPAEPTPHVVRIRPTSAYIKAKRRRTFSQRSRSRARAALTDEDLELFGDSGTGLFTMNDLRNALPFAVMSPNKLPTALGSFLYKDAPDGGLFPPSYVEALSQNRGQFTRKYRWGPADVLDPQHCDYLALRHSILGVRMKMLKRTTREVLYEKYRTEQLLARRRSMKTNTEML
ncbi:Septin-domain-containing protein [Cantharellus anzutake]|uniref:Septin-domain-containing protein n=1 Tax=Cantharellus anzutake TaxID=1750568 RepID=UPI00190871F3|nr:Septin-domain-containing protein [Cantharellus anzutake]XP_038918227.1 Septin-domain-containing protein [Cantharellus anzutake]KAF8324756.1 Septin-domain-containing protein [Cantharellus anzutake]KAF8334721.1 Septin-domain-containing protein [Cantharellus anzutake]